MSVWRLIKWYKYYTPRVLPGVEGSKRAEATLLAKSMLRKKGKLSDSLTFFVCQ